MNLEEGKAKKKKINAHSDPVNAEKHLFFFIVEVTQIWMEIYVTKGNQQIERKVN